MNNKENKLSTCLVCGLPKPEEFLTPVFAVRKAIIEQIRADGIKCEEKEFICADDLNKYRKIQIAKMVEKEKGALSALEKEVIDSFNDNDLMAEDVDEDFDESLSFGERISDKIAAFGGSWTFIISFLFLVLLWMAFNTFYLLNKGFDAYPYILLNLILSCIAAIQAPVIMMSQNRQETRDRLRSKNDYKVNLKAEIEIRMLHEKIDFMLRHQGNHLHEIEQTQLEIMEEVNKQKIKL